MNVLIVGAGLLGQTLGRLLAKDHRVSFFDSRRLWVPGPLFRGDVRDPRALLRAMKGMDAVAHTAALYGRAMWSRPPEDFLRVNVDGTYNVLWAARRSGARRVVFSSTAAVYGKSLETRFLVDETTPCEPDHIYGLSKLLAEQLCLYHGRRFGLETVCLRYAKFLPVPKEEHGPGLLHERVDVRDAAQANRLALEKPSLPPDVFLIGPRTPFQEGDAHALKDAPEAAIEKHFPGAAALLKKRGIPAPAVRNLFRIEKARQALGYDPQHGFSAFLEELARADWKPTPPEAPPGWFSKAGARRLWQAGLRRLRALRDPYR